MKTALPAHLSPGDPAPWFEQRNTSSERYHFDTVGGRYIVLCFFGSAAAEHGKTALAAIERNRSLFDDDKIALFGVSLDPADEKQGRIKEQLPGIRHFWDADGKVSMLYGVLTAPPGPQSAAFPVWYVLDPTLRVMKTVPFRKDGSDATDVMDYLRRLPPAPLFAGTELQAPVLFLPNVFEPEFCARLMDLYKSTGGVESGFMREMHGKTVAVSDYGHKRRRDHLIDDPALQVEVQKRIHRRIHPEIKKAFQFNVSRIERYIVACYRAEDNAHFKAHRDDTTKGTAHRRFAVTINLNSEFEGGELSFPEYGPRSFKPPPGGAVVFSCSLLHAVSRVTQGERFCFLPFLYDEAAKKIRDENAKYLDLKEG